jgi:hypothetical protein
VNPAARSEQTWEVPELGPSLGRLVDPPASATGALDVPLADLRIDLVSRVFDLAGAARSFAAAGDVAGAVSSLGRVAWLGAWEKTVGAVAARIVAAANRGMEAAAEESRFPARRLKQLLLTEEDARAVAARLGSGGAPFVAALDALEKSGQIAARSREQDAGSGTAWQSALGAAARRLESAWMALEEAALREQARWAEEVTRVRSWHRPAWPVWLATALVAALAVWLGLILGGYIPVPPGLHGFASFWWSHL